MKNWGTTYSKVKPDETRIDDYSVWVASDITETEQETEEGESYTMYEYNLIQYTKEEYIQMQGEEIDALEDEVLTTQEALCELYESII